MTDTTLSVFDLQPSHTDFYFRVTSPLGLVWNGSAYVAFVVADMPSYRIPAVEDPVGSGRYFGDFPASSPVGNYTVTIYEGTGTTGDVRLATAIGGMYYNGTELGGVPGVPEIQATLAGYDTLVASGSVVDEAPTATTFLCSADTGLSDDPNVYKTLSICFMDGDLKAAKSVVTNWNGSTKRVIVAGFAKAPANGDHFKVI